jgi:predicted ester cyclase
MSVEQNKAVIRRLVDEVFNQKNLTIVEELVTPDWRFHGPLSMEYQGRAGFRIMLKGFYDSMPDLHVRLLDMIGEGDKVFHLWQLEATLKGPYQGIPLDGKQLSQTIYHLSRFENSKEAEIWECSDTFTMLQGLGVTPNMAPAAK